MMKKNSFFPPIGITFLLFVTMLSVSGCAANRLVRATWQGDVRRVQILLDQGEAVNGVDYGAGLEITEIPTALHVAAQEGHTQIMTLLLNRGANVNAGDRNEMTPLHWAVRGRQMGALQLLLDRGANLGAKNIWGWTSLHIAAYNGRTEIVQFLLQRGAWPDALDNTGQTPAVKAKEGGHMALASVLSLTLLYI